jgi:hypothetical protein
LWHVPGQYTQLRTPAADFFSPADYAELEQCLLEHGQRALGVSGLSPLWLSLYVAGCKQELHADVPHGPWALVLSLTPSPRAFAGGETQILLPSTLDYWRNFSYDSVVERSQLVQRVAPEFNRLVTFDSRCPHGVSAVEGTLAPLDGRMVVHGWFTEPQPFFEPNGGIGEQEASDALNAALGPCFEALAEAPPALGVLAVRIRVRGGETVSLEALSDTLVARPGGGAEPEEVREEILAAIQEALDGCVWPASETETVITMPFVFE